MQNSVATIYLNTPLVQTKNQDEIVIYVKGKILQTDVSGLTINVKGLGNEKRWSEEPTYKKIFIPMHKVDFVSLDD